MSLPLGPKADLQHLLEKLPPEATAARGRLLGIWDYIAELEAVIGRLEAARRAGLEARLSAQTPERRSQIASLAARRRWSCERRASDNADLFQV